jgi:MYXO-CTERM domain-containing protein
MFCTNCAARAGPRAWTTALVGLLALAALFTSGSDVYAQQQDSILKQAFKVFGFATDVGPQADFVNKTRAASDPDYIPVFQPPPEPARQTMKNDELKAVKGDLDGVQKQHDTLRQGFAPAAKAMAEQQAAQKKPKPKAPGAPQ